MDARAADVLKFWFEELTPKDWFMKSDDLDNQIKLRFKELLDSAKQSEYYSWRTTPKESLAEVILLDQFARNIYRDTPEAFDADPLALSLSQHAIEKGFDKELSDVEKSFLYMPFMHSESKQIHVEALVLFKDLPANYDFELRHKEIIDRFGRYPHRNKILGRESTPEEIEFLKTPGSGF